MKKLPKKYIIVEIIPTHSSSKKGFIAQLQALKIEDKQIKARLDMRVNPILINNTDIQKMINYDNDMFIYTDSKDEIMAKFQTFIGHDKVLYIDNFYTTDYLSTIKNKVSIFPYLDMVYSDDVFDLIITKYHLPKTNHFVDLLYEALMLR